MRTDHWKTIKSINTRRRYALYFSNSNAAPSIHSLLSIINYSLSDDYEWAHSLCDKLDAVLDLRVAESMTFHPNRDDKDSRREIGIIKRVQ